ncbi:MULTISPECIES: PilW family protein [Gammaproteobacteria]|uniref:PilW family protein n=1 Tax=Gammaproteobacteria TaxID=1236 RepID=UPI000DD0CFE8|nr:MULTISPECIES: type II secretion system protein [Gammaproteobacteria]RTE86378.1 type II secretion system protein [Aliidiomarina sp. B3213]TCZ91726.1 type II secretion system protein [Lysobacter sp. N42]
MRSGKGFTLIELIVVIVLLGIVGTFTFSYLGFGARIFSDSVEREQLLSQSRFAVERLSRELKNALPRSIRVSATDNQRCIEFVPILAASSYVQIPLPGPTSSDDFVGVTPSVPSNVSLVGGSLYVYATTLNHIYGNSSRKKNIDTLSADTPNAGLTTFNYSDSPTHFPTESPARRYFVTSTPVSWCMQGTRPNQQLVRFSGYGFNINQPSLATLLGSVSGEVMAAQLDNDLSQSAQYPFQVFEATLQRNSLVQFDFRFARDSGNEPLRIQHEVHVPNVP